MTDIVERLRNPSQGSPRWGNTMEEAAVEIERLRAEAERNVERANAETLDAICRRTEAERDEAVATLALYRAERDRLQAGLLRVMQYEQKCDQTGQSCDGPRGCACSREAETWCDGDGT